LGSSGVSVARAQVERAGLGVDHLAAVVGGVRVDGVKRGAGAQLDRDVIGQRADLRARLVDHRLGVERIGVRPERLDHVPVGLGERARQLGRVFRGPVDRHRGGLLRGGDHEVAELLVGHARRAAAPGQCQGGKAGGQRGAKHRVRS
jgi:hypothetical protein